MQMESPVIQKVLRAGSHCGRHVKIIKKIA
jgi:hypothetical protein